MNASIGSIPAGAGKTCATEATRCSRAVHPRGCGENYPDRRALITYLGPSPRVRGKRRVVLDHMQLGRSIPAGAGKTSAAERSSLAVSVYPRGCGENAQPSVALPMKSGPSPRVRGKPEKAPAHGARCRSIPAGAGKTRCWTCWISGPPVHPRGCGENSRMRIVASAATGPSPRVRGKPASPQCQSGSVRSIPAGAGKTWRSARPPAP